MTVDFIFACGRLNPVTKGHCKIIDVLSKLGKQYNIVPKLYLTMTVDNKRNPLSPAAKAEFVKRAFPEMDVEMIKGPYAVIDYAAKCGYKSAIMVVGQDREENFQSLVDYAKTLDIELKLESITRADESYSASKARKAALRNNYLSFSQMIPKPDKTFANELFHAVRHGLGAE